MLRESLSSKSALLLDFSHRWIYLSFYDKLNLVCLLNRPGHKLVFYLVSNQILDVVVLTDCSFGSDLLSQLKDLLTFVLQKSLLLLQLCF